MPDPAEPGSAVAQRPAPNGQALRWLLALALLYTLYFARSLLIPLVVALFVAALLGPLVNLLKRFHIPRSVSALVLLTCIGGPIGLLGVALAEPAQTWFGRLQEVGIEMSQQLDQFTEKLSPERKAEAEPKKESGFSLFGWFDGEKKQPPPPAKESGAVTTGLMQGGVQLAISALGATPILLVQFLTFLVLVLFLLIFGTSLYQNAIEIFPRVRDKRTARLVVGRVQRELSRYIITVSLINAGLGLATGTALSLLGVQDAPLWGALVGMFNFAPYVGPLVSAFILTIAGVVQYGLEPGALMPAGVYLAINMVEAQFVTPMVLGRHMRLNPLILVIWILAWGWLWGAAGVLLAVPLLVSLKLAARQLGVLEYWVRLVETRA